MRTKQNKGRYGEDVAAAYLRANGYLILETNFRCKAGEVDIISQKDGYLIFTEVKYRKSLEYGLPREAVTASKQRHIRNVALFYMRVKNLLEVDVRFDVAEIIDQGTCEITLLENAF